MKTMYEIEMDDKTYLRLTGIMVDLLEKTGDSGFLALARSAYGNTIEGRELQAKVAIQKAENKFLRDNFMIFESQGVEQKIIRGDNGGNRK